MTTQTPIEMAREAVADLVCSTSPPKLAASARKSIMAGNMCMAQVDAALAMHTRLTAAHDEAVRELVEGLRVGIGSAYPVSSEINRRGYNWSEAYLDQWLPIAQALIAKHRASISAAASPG